MKRIGSSPPQWFFGPDWKLCAILRRWREAGEVVLFSSARFENLEWKNADHKGFPILFFIPLQHLSYGILSAWTIERPGCQACSSMFRKWQVTTEVATSKTVVSAMGQQEWQSSRSRMLIFTTSEHIEKSFTTLLQKESDVFPSKMWPNIFGIQRNFRRMWQMVFFGPKKPPCPYVLFHRFFFRAKLPYGDCRNSQLSWRRWTKLRRSSHGNFRGGSFGSFCSMIMTSSSKNRKSRLFVWPFNVQRFFLQRKSVKVWCCFCIQGFPKPRNGVALGPVRP